MIPDPPGGVGRDREPAGRATTTAPTGSAGEADGGRPRARRGGGGDRDPVEKSRAARVLGNAAGRGGREGERRRPRGRSSPSRDVRGGAPRTHDAREGRTSGTGRVIDRSPRRRQPEESGHATRWGISPPGAQPGADGGSPHVRRERPSRRTDDGAGRVPRRTSADGPTVNSRRPRTTPAKPLSLARFPETRGGLLFFPHSHRPHLRDRRARRRRRTSGGDGPRRVRRRAGDDRPPFLQRPRPRERSRARDARTGSPAPRRDGSPLLPDRGNAAGERGSEATPHGTPQRATHTHATRTARPRTRERQRRGSAGGTARGGHGRCGRVGPGSPPPPSPALPARLRAPRRAHHPPRGSGVTGGGPAALGRAHDAGPFVPRPRVTTSQAPARHAGVTARSLLPRVVPPRTRSEEARAAAGTQTLGFPPQKSGRGEGNPARATRIGRVTGRAGATQGGSDGRPQARPFIGSLEKALFSLRAGGTDPARRAPGRGSPKSGGNDAR